MKAVKLHQLMVLKNTVLARRFGENHNYIKPLNEYEYAAGLKAFLQELPEGTLLMRLMADADVNHNSIRLNCLINSKKRVQESL